MMNKQAHIDKFYRQHGPCCAGCDWWRWHNSVIGDCTKSAPVSAEDRWSIVGLSWASAPKYAGHIVTPRDYVCGDFVDSLPLVPPEIIEKIKKMMDALTPLKTHADTITYDTLNEMLAILRGGQ